MKKAMQDYRRAYRAIWMALDSVPNDEVVRAVLHNVFLDYVQEMSAFNDTGDDLMVFEEEVKEMRLWLKRRIEGERHDDEALVQPRD